jgi:hypothetical protein
MALVASIKITTNATSPPTLCFLMEDLPTPTDESNVVETLADYKDAFVMPM